MPQFPLLFMYSARKKLSHTVVLPWKTHTNHVFLEAGNHTGSLEECIPFPSLPPTVFTTQPGFPGLPTTQEMPLKSKHFVESKAMHW